MIALRLAIPVGAGIKVVSGCAVHVCLCGKNISRRSVKRKWHLAYLRHGSEALFVSMSWYLFRSRIP